MLCLFVPKRWQCWQEVPVEESTCELFCGNNNRDLSKTFYNKNCPYRHNILMTTSYIVIIITVTFELNTWCDHIKPTRSSKRIQPILPWLLKCLFSQWKGGMMQPLNYNTMKCLLVSGDFLWYYINFTNRGVSGLTFKTTFCTIHSQIKLRPFSICIFSF